VSLWHHVNAIDTFLAVCQQELVVNQIALNTMVGWWIRDNCKMGGAARFCIKASILDLCIQPLKTNCAIICCMAMYIQTTIQYLLFVWQNLNFVIFSKIHNSRLVLLCTQHDSWRSVNKPSSADRHIFNIFTPIDLLQLAVWISSTMLPLFSYMYMAARLKIFLNFSLSFIRLFVAVGLFFL